MVRIGVATTNTLAIWNNASRRAGWRPKPVDILKRQAEELFRMLHQGPTGAYHAIELVLGEERAGDVYRGQAALPFDVVHAAARGRKRKRGDDLGEFSLSSSSDEEVEPAENDSYDWMA